MPDPSVQADDGRDEPSVGDPPGDRRRAPAPTRAGAVPSGDAESAPSAILRRAGGALVIAATTEADWREYRAVRLRALGESPAAFGSSLDRELGFDDAVWRERAASGRTLLARVGGSAVGLVTTIVEDGRPDERQITSMWVDPSVRGSGAGRALVLAALGVVRGEGVRRATLFVATGNEEAARFYRRLGFRSTGERQPLPSDPARGEERYSIDV